MSDSKSSKFGALIGKEIHGVRLNYTDAKVRDNKLKARARRDSTVISGSDSYSNQSGRALSIKINFLPKSTAGPGFQITKSKSAIKSAFFPLIKFN
jgi:hypothetical protein